MSYNKVLQYYFFFITVLTLSSDLIKVNPVACMIKTTFRNNPSNRIISRMLSTVNVSKNNNTETNIFFSSIYSYDFSKSIILDILKKSIFTSFHKEFRRPSFVFLHKRLMSEKSDDKKSTKSTNISDNTNEKNDNKNTQKMNDGKPTNDDVNEKEQAEKEPTDTHSTSKSSEQITHYRTDYKPSPFSVEHVTLKIDIFDHETVVNSRLDMNITSHYIQNDLVFDGVGLKINKILIDSNPLIEGKHYTYNDEFLTIYANYVPKGKFVFESEVIIHPETNYALNGLYKSKDLIVSQCESTGFRRITFFIDRPDIMSKFNVTLTADKTKYPILLSNGDKTKEFDVKNTNRHGAEFNDPFKKPCYLFAVVAGDLKFIKDKHITKFTKKNVDLYVYSEEKYVSKLIWALECLKRAMVFDEEFFGLEYDLSRLNLVAVSDFNAGAMENKGLNIFNANSLLASKKKSVDYAFERILSVVSHEYFHNYTGNRVTLRDWFQLTLKEGLTVHRENIFSEEETKTATYRLDNINVLRNVQFVEDSSPFSHPIRPESYISMDNFYTTTIYYKGSEVMRMYQTILGDEYYKKGITMYLTKRDGNTATCEDFNNSMEEAYKLKKNDKNASLDQYLLWYSQSGTPIVNVEYIYDENKKLLTLNLTQKTNPDNNQKEKKPLFIPIKIGFVNRNGGPEVIPEVLLEFTKESDTFTFKNVPEKPIPSLFRGLSAPVHITDNLTDNERITLLKYDTDAFVRYNVCVDLYAKQIITNYNELLKAAEKNIPTENVQFTPINVDVMNAVKHIIQDKNVDAGFKAYIITLPSFRYMVTFITKINTDILADAYDYIYTEMGKHLNDTLFDIFNTLEPEANDMTHFEDESYVDFDQINKRKFRNTILTLLSKTKYKDIVKSIMKHSESLYVSNWLTSFSASAYIDINKYNELYVKTYDRAKDDELLLQEWIKTVSRSDTPYIFDIIKKLENEILQDSKNPNIIRAVFLPFSYGLRHFHHKSGKGYKIIADIVINVDKYNPTLSSNLCGPFKIWNKLDDARQTLMLKEIDRILNSDNISNNLKEFLSKLTNKM
uniref:M1 family aminopeptidase-like n=1 Tax=Piliocolobus tephrosceles TaxID=591936 RepID=A0A8C9H049_9PRIM